MQILFITVAVAVRPEAKILAAWLLRSRVRIPLWVWMYFFICCVILSRGLATSWSLIQGVLQCVCVFDRNSNRCNTGVGVSVEIYCFCQLVAMPTSCRQQGKLSPFNTTFKNFDMCCSVHFYIASNSLKPTNAHFIMFGTLHVSLHVSIHMDHHQGTTRLLHIFILYICDLVIVLWLS